MKTIYHAVPQGCLVVAAAFLMSFQAHGQILWYETMGPHFNPSVPAADTGDVYYTYEWVGDSWGDAGPWVAGVLKGMTTEYATKNGSVIRDRGTAELRSHSKYPNHCYADNPAYFYGTDPSYNFSYVSSQMNYYGLPYAVYSTYGVPGQWSVELWICPASPNPTYYSDTCSCPACGTLVYTYGWSAYYMAVVWVAQGVTPPSLPAPSSIVVRDYYYPLVWVQKIADAKESPQTYGKFRVYRSCTGPALAVNYALSGTATGPSPSMDFTLGGGSSTSVTIPNGSTSVDIDVIPWYDGYADSGETVILTLTSSGSYVIGSPSSATVYIND